MMNHQTKKSKNRLQQGKIAAIQLSAILLSAIPTLASSMGSAALAARPQEDPERYYRAPNSLHGKTVLIPAGSHIEGRITSTISSAKSKQGEHFTIEITSPVLANGTDVVIPVGSRIIGEVVEALPSGRQPRQKGMPKPNGKLRTSLSMLQTPDGVSRPLIATIAGEFIASGRGVDRPNDEINEPNLGYAGNQSSFDAVHPTMGKKNQHGKGPQVVDRRQYFKDPILGSSTNKHQHGSQVIRSMVKKGREIYIYSGSPLTVRIDAPFKVAVAPSAGRMSIDIGSGAPPMDGEGSDMKNFRRFQPVSREDSQSGSQSESGRSTGSSKNNHKRPALRQAPDPEAHLPVFLRSPKKDGEFLNEPDPMQDTSADFNAGKSKDKNQSQGQQEQQSQPQGGDDF